MNETSPIPIIIGALMATLAVGIVATQAMSFGTTQDEHSNLDELTEYVNEIENACDAVDEYGRLPISQEFEVELVRAEIEVEGHGDDYEATLVRDEEDDSEPLEISCNTELDGMDDIDSGTTEIRISSEEDEDGEVEIAVEVE